MNLRRVVLVLILLGLPVPGAMQQSVSPVVVSGFIFELAPFPSAHASTIVETQEGLVVAWFGGTAEGRSDVGIWVSRRNGTHWSAPVEAANGRRADGTREPCWNPVLFQPSDGPLLLFYKVGPSPREWRGYVRLSSDGGRTWSAQVALPKGILGPIRAKPVSLAPGMLLAGSSTEHAGWKAHIERFTGLSGVAGKAWTAERLASPGAWRATAALNDAVVPGVIQPTFLVHSPTRLQILCRSQQGVVTQAWSEDGGETWGPMTSTSLPNPNAGIDAVRLADRRFLLVYNPTMQDRHKLELAVSRDGVSWRSAVVLEDSPGEYSYPAIIQARDGMVHVTYTWRRERIKHVTLDPSRIQ